MFLGGVNLIEQVCSLIRLLYVLVMVVLQVHGQLSEHHFNGLNIGHRTGEPFIDAAFYGNGGIVASAKRGTELIETSTLPLAKKHEIRDRCAARGITVLDCPVSGTGAQAANRDIAIYASGDRKAEAALKGFSRSVYYCSEYSIGSKLKYVANLLVTIRNVSAAEAMVVGMKSGLDLELLYKVIKDGAGTSRMFEVRGPLMITGDYSKATMKVDVYKE